MSLFSCEIPVRWADCDMNRHVRHSAYYDYGAHARIRYFAEHGFTAAKMAALHIGPIIFKEECSFIKELKLEDVVTINVLKGETRADGSRWIIHHEIFNSNQEKCAHITLHGAWIDLNKRRLTIPSEEMAAMMNALAVGEAFSYKKKS